MQRIVLFCVVALGAMLAFQPQPKGADVDQPKVDIPFGTLVRGGPCPVATHMVLGPCYPHSPMFFVAFPDGKNVTRYEGQNVTLRGTVDQTSCSLPLIHASRVSLSKVLPDCPP